MVEFGTVWEYDGDGSEGSKGAPCPRGGPALSAAPGAVGSAAMTAELGSVVAEALQHGFKELLDALRREIDDGSSGKDLADTGGGHEWARRHRRLYGKRVGAEDQEGRMQDRETVERSMRVLSRRFKKRITWTRLRRAVESIESPKAGRQELRQDSAGSWFSDATSRQELRQDSTGLRAATLCSWPSESEATSIALENGASPTAAWGLSEPPLPPVSPGCAVPQPLRQLPGALAADSEADDGSEGSDGAADAECLGSETPSIENVDTGAPVEGHSGKQPAGTRPRPPQLENSTLQTLYTEMRRSSNASVLPARVSAQMPTGAQAKEGLGRAVRALVRSSKFEGFMCILILVNALILGIQTDHVARSAKSDEVPSFYKTLEAIFCVIFVFEIAVRVYAYRWGFFYKGGWAWNVFDLIVVSIQVIEQVMSVLTANNAGDALSNLSTTRIIRILRLIRVMRVARILQGISELRILVLSILSSVRSMFWTVVLLLLIIYTFGLFVTQMVADHKRELDPSSDVSRLLHGYYGDLGSTMLTLFMSISGGVDYDSVCRPLMDIWWPMAAVFVIYIAFAVLMMLNTVTGVFVESVLQSQARDRDAFMVSNARELFQGLEGGLHAQMGWEVFQSKADSPQMKEFFKAIDVAPSEAKCLFDLLDLDGSGAISANEFLSGAMRLRGPAKSLDLAVLVSEVRQIDKHVRALARA